MPSWQVGGRPLAYGEGSPLGPGSEEAAVNERVGVRLGFWQAASIIAGYGIGGGVLALPYLVSLNGLAPSLAILVAVLLVPAFSRYRRDAASLALLPGPLASSAAGWVAAAAYIVMAAGSMVPIR